jgi:hypothetical protein
MFGALLALSVVAGAVADGAVVAPDSSSPAPGSAMVAVPAASEAPVPADGSRRFLRVAVYDLAVDGVEPRVGRFVTDAIVAELRKLDGVSVVAMDEVRAMLAHEAAKELVGCTEGPSCLSEIGDALGVDELVVGNLAVVGAVSVVTLRRIDQTNAKAVGAISKRLAPAQGEEFLAEVGPSVEKLFKDKALRTGSVRGVPPAETRRLNPPPLSPWMPAVTGASGLILLAAGAGAGLAALGEEGAHSALLEEAKTTPVSGSLVVDAGKRAQGYAVVANVLYGVAAVTGLGALAMVPFTNFDTAPVE